MHSLPLQLKIIQGRIVAQAFLLSGAAVGAASHFLNEPEHVSQSEQVKHARQQAVAKMRNFDLPPVVAASIETGVSATAGDALK